MKNNLVFLFLIIGLFSCTKNEARRPVSAKTHVSLASTTEDLKKLNEIEDAKVLAYIKKDSLATYINSKEGFWYTIIFKSNDTVFPKMGDIVTFDYEIKNLFDQVIYSKEELGKQQYLVDKQELIQGLQLGIKKMNKGDVVKFLLPAYNAYGIVGDQNKIAVNQSIIAIVTLQSIN